MVVSHCCLAIVLGETPGGKKISCCGRGQQEEVDIDLVNVDMSSAEIVSSTLPPSKDAASRHHVSAAQATEEAQAASIDMSPDATSLLHSVLEWQRSTHVKLALRVKIEQQVSSKLMTPEAMKPPKHEAMANEWSISQLDSAFASAEGGQDCCRLVNAVRETQRLGIRLPAANGSPLAMCVELLSGLRVLALAQIEHEHLEAKLKELKVSTPETVK